MPIVAEGYSLPSVRIINAPSSFSEASSSTLHRTLPPSYAKHLACSLSTQPACLFLTPSLLPIHLDSLYAAYLCTAPSYSQLTSMISPHDAFRIQHLRFENHDKDLHAGTVFSLVLGRDMQEHIARKEHSRRFWKQIAMLLPDIPGDMADVYWSMWMNTFPELVSQSNSHTRCDKWLQFG